MNNFKSKELQHEWDFFLNDIIENRPINIQEVSDDIKLLEENLRLQFVDITYHFHFDNNCYLIWKRHGNKDSAKHRIIYVKSGVREGILGDMPTNIRFEVYPHLPNFLKNLTLTWKENGYKDYEY